MNYIIYDLECTCWEDKTDEQTMETIEIGAVRLNEYGEVMGAFSRFIRPKIHPVLSDFCQRLILHAAAVNGTKFANDVAVTDFH